VDFAPTFEDQIHDLPGQVRSEMPPPQLGSGVGLALGVAVPWGKLKNSDDLGQRPYASGGSAAICS
jgi:hypothetical protein